MPRNTAAKFANGSSLTDPPDLDLDLTNNPNLAYPADQIRSWTSRVASNSSRNPLIDSAIQPGPYKEVLPCIDLCHDLMQSCPASLGFACPLPGKGLELSYGRKSRNPAEISCSYLGAAYYLSHAAGRVGGAGPSPPSLVGAVGFVLIGNLFWLWG